MHDPRVTVFTSILYLNPSATKLPLQGISEGGQAVWEAPQQPPSHRSRYDKEGWLCKKKQAVGRFHAKDSWKVWMSRIATSSSPLSLISYIMNQMASSQKSYK